jgi:DNA-binding winged helix-turn-helix (wHTH) protein/Tol biopolymer transport system component
MNESATSRHVIRFGAFEVDLRAGELRKNGLKIKLQEQPLQVLAMLLRHPGEVVTREELQKTVWPADTFVDFDRGLNKAINKIREALEDSADHPRFVETLPRRGYRFIALLDVGGAFMAAEQGHPGGVPQRQRAGLALPSPERRVASAFRRRWPLILAAVVLVLTASAGIIWFFTQHRHPKTELSERQLTANPPEDHVMGAAVSPDGKHVAYNDQTGLYLRSIDSGETHAVSLPAGFQDRIWELKWFPDGGKLLAQVGAPEGFDFWMITIMGEAAPHFLYRGGVNPAISPDGQSVAFDKFELGKPGGGGVWVGGINGESPRELVAGKEDQVVFSPAWSPDGRWIAYLRFWKTAYHAIEVRPVGGGPAKSLISESNLPKLSSLRYHDLPRLAWSPDWRLVFFATQTPESLPSQEQYSLWEVPVEPRTGEAAGRPERLTQWSDFAPLRTTITADGKRLALLKERVWQDVYLGELGPDGTSMKPPRRFTLDDRGSYLQDWARDSKAVVFTSNRSSKWEIFSQGLDERVAEAVVRVSRDHLINGAAMSPDGSWILYDESARATLGAPPSPHRLMRRATAGGSPEMVFEEAVDTRWDYWCPEKPGSSCVLSEKEGKDFVFYSLDPVRGKGEQLGKIEASGFAGWSVSPDGSRLALVDPGKQRRIEVLTFQEGGWHEVSVEPGWGQFESIAWAAGGNGFFVTSRLPNSWNLLHVTLTGKLKPLLRNGRRQWIANPLPSPDGKYLAFEAQTRDSNVWMLEGF